MSVDRILQSELARLNMHLPKQRISLKDALSMASPHIVAGDGSKHTFERAELERLGQIVPPNDWDNLRLPILIAINPKFGRGAAEISGELEAKVVSSVLDKEALGEELIIYRPEIAVLRARLPTTTQYMFMVG